MLEPYIVRPNKAQPHDSRKMDQLDYYMALIFAEFDKTWLLDRVIEAHLIDFEKISIS